jgi:hypothetical protein
MRLAIYVGVFCSILATALSTCPTLTLQLSNCTVPGTSVDSWGVAFTFGSQDLCLAPSTVVNTTLLIGSDYCQSYPNGTFAQCESLSGQTFNISAAGASYNASTPAILGSNPVWNAISSNQLLAGNTSLYLPGNGSLPNFPVGIITSGDNQNVGHLGLATNSQFLHHLKENCLITQNGFGLDAGSQSVENPRAGTLVLGGYDQASIKGHFSTFPIGDTNSNGKQCPFQVMITNIAVRSSNPAETPDYELSSDGPRLPTCIEP